MPVFDPYVLQDKEQIIHFTEAEQTISKLIINTKSEQPYWKLEIITKNKITFQAKFNMKQDGRFEMIR